MNGGDPVVGGNQVTPGDTRPVISGPQPATPAAVPQSFSTNSNIPQGSPVPTPAAPTATVPTISNTPITSDADFSSLHSGPTPSFAPPANPLASTPSTSQPSSPLGAGMPAPMPGTPMQNTFSQTPLAQNGFTQNPFSGGVYSPNVYGQGEDIVIGGSTGAKPHKSKTKVILAVLAILIVLAGVVWAVVSSFGGLMGNNRNAILSSFDVYKRYANYLLYGEDKTDDISDNIIWEKQNTIPNLMLFDGAEERVSYANKLQELYNSFSEVFEKIDLEKIYGDDKEVVQNIYNGTTLGVESLSRFIKSGNISFGELAQLYLEGGEKNMSTVISEKYGEVDTPAEDLYSQFIASKKQEAEAVSALYNYYSSISCITDGHMDPDCVMSHADDTNMATLQETAYNTSEESNLLADHIVYDTISYSNYLYTFLKEEENVQEN